MADDNDHRIKRTEDGQDEEEVVYKLVKIGQGGEYEPPAFTAKDAAAAKSESWIYCNCHTVCGCDSVNANSCGCHDVCTCDYVCTCDAHSSSASLCTCNTVEYCTCNAVCTCNTYSPCSCDSHTSCSCDSVHYWYPN